jgi:NAD(P)-dependent dehydrogenase (short-subunit alcohol dehydrogenase family)
MGVVIVTGGSRGIGAATASLAADRGWRVAVNYLKDQAAADRVVNAIREKGGRAVAIRADTSDETAVTAMFNHAERELGPVTGLVNNAGWNGGTATVAELEYDTLRRIFEINVFGYFICAREAVRRMSTERGGPGGAIVNVSSVGAIHGSVGERVHYAATKGAVNSFTTGLSKEVIRQRIRVNAVSPGLIETDMNPADRLARLVPTVPINRAADPIEVARAILFLLSDEASYMVGANMVVSGGR